jgi:hypothetical protein
MSVFSIITRARVQNGNFTCEADTESETLLLSGECDGARSFTLRVAAKDVTAIISALGDAYDWRKQKMKEGS